MKRVFKIILILIAAFALTLLIIWLVGRGKSQKTGQTPLTFKQFLGLGTKTNSGQTVPGETSSTFTGKGTGAGGNGSGIGTGDNGFFNAGAGNDIRISNFTNGSINPGRGGNGSNGDGLGDNGAGSGGTGSGGNGTDTGSGDTGNADNGPICSQEDTTITFTADELAQLKELQNRFYTIAQTLHTDADVDTEVANHDAFAVKADQVTELYNYCEAKLASITDPRLQQRVATPFWHTDGDSLSFLNFKDGGLNAAHLTDVHDNNHDPASNADTSGIRGPYGVLSWSNPAAVSINGSILTGSVFNDPFTGKSTTLRGNDIQLLVPVVEKILRINLW